MVKENLSLSRLVFFLLILPIWSEHVNVSFSDPKCSFGQPECSSDNLPKFFPSKTFLVQFEFCLIIILAKKLENGAQISKFDKNYHIIVRLFPHLVIQIA